MPLAGAKRGRSYTTMAQANAAAKVLQRAWRKKTAGRSAFRKALAGPGFTRTGGYYGQFGGPGGELKFHDVDMNTLIDEAGETVNGQHLVQIAQGDTQSQRDGNKIVVKSIHFKGTLLYNPDTANQSQAGTCIYMYIIQDTQCNGTAPTVGNANSGIFTTSDLSTAFMTLANSNRFKVLKKLVYTMNPPSGVSGAFGPVAKRFDVFKKCHIPIVYDASATTGALTTVRSNNLWLIAGCAPTLPGGLSDAVQLTSAVRIRFQDMR